MRQNAKKHEFPFKTTFANSIRVKKFSQWPSNKKDGGNFCEIFKKYWVFGQALANEIEPTTTNTEVANLVLLEDNQEFSTVLSYLYSTRNKKLALYHTPYALLTHLEEYSKDTKICLDYDLNCPITGLELAKVLWEKGYKKLYLATGFKMKQEDLPPYLSLLEEKMELINL